MLVFTGIASIVDNIGGLFGTVADRVDDVPLLGDRISAPFRSIEGWFGSLGANFRTAQAWADGITYQVWEAVTSADTWLLDPVGSLWSGIWDQVRTVDTWLLDPIEYVWEGIRERIPDLSGLVDEIRQEVEGRLTDLRQAVADLPETIRETAWDNFILRFDDWFIWWVEWNAEKVILVATKVLDIMLIDDGDRERWSKWR